jgi:serine/threonine protein kinase
MLNITDFGLSTRLDSLDSTTGNYVGSQMFMSPERLRGEQYGYAGDVFSLGVTVAQMLMGQHPLTDSLGEAMTGPVEVWFWGLCGAMRINDGLDVSVAATQLSFRIALAPHCSPCMLDFILRCVHADPSKRPTCSELLRHAFVRPLLNTNAFYDDSSDDDDDDADDLGGGVDYCICFPQPTSVREKHRPTPRACSNGCTQAGSVRRSDKHNTKRLRPCFVVVVNTVCIVVA